MNTIKSGNISIKQIVEFVDAQQDSVNKLIQTLTETVSKGEGSQTNT